MSDNLQVIQGEWTSRLGNYFCAICTDRGPYSWQSAADEVTQAEMHHFSETLECVALLAI